MGFSLPALPEEPEESNQETKPNANSYESQSKPQETLWLLNQQTEKIRNLEDLLGKREERIQQIETELEEMEIRHGMQMQTLQDELDAANSRADGTISSVNREHLRRESELRTQMKVAVEAKKAAARKVVKNAHRWLCVMIGYGLLVTLCAAVYQRSFGAACLEFGRIFSHDVWPGVYLAIQAPARLAHMADDIPDEAWAGIVYWTVLIVTCGAACWGIRWSAGSVRQFSRFYRTHMADWISLSVVLVTVAVAVFFAGPLRTIGMNAIAMILLTNVGYTAVRGIKIYRRRHFG